MIWELGRGRNPQEWIPAQVPGAVQLDWARSQGWPPYWKGKEWRRYEGLEDSFWTYRTQITATDQPTALHLKGVDYEFEVYLNGDKLHHQKAMFTPAQIDLSGRLAKDSILEVVLHPAPKDPTAPAPRRESRRTTKPAVSCGWDFHPRLIPLGIWDDARLGDLEWKSEFTYCLSDDLREAHLQVSGDQDSWELWDPSGSLVLDSSATESVLNDPLLWWPHDQGEQNLYTLKARQGDSLKEKKIGFRRAKLVMHENAWAWPSEFPKGRSNPPITLEINGRKIFAKGSNWVSPEIFPGLLHRDTYQSHLDLVKGANMNILRMWGGAPVQKDSFYEICDELGIMVWQEFPIACNLAPDDDEYLEILNTDSRSIIRRLRHHPSVVMWCGGNELFNSWSGMTDQSHPLRLLGANTFELDRFTPFLPTSPVMGMAHGGYTFRDPHTKEECWAMFQRSDATAYTEFGCAGISSVETLRSFLPEEEEFPPTRGSAWEDHHAFGAWQGDTWLDLGTIDHYFGESQTLEQLVRRGQLLQAEGFRGIFEEARRQKPKCSMALNWCLNEPWPTAANNSLIEWPSKPKPALATVGLACRPTLASAKISKFKWLEGEWFDPELWLLHDGPKPVQAGVMVAKLGDKEILRWEFGDIPPQTNLRGPKCGVQMPSMAGETFDLRIEVEGRPHLNSTYRLAYGASAKQMTDAYCLKPPGQNN